MKGRLTSSGARARGSLGSDRRQTVLVPARVILATWSTIRWNGLRKVMIDVDD